eukprot:8833877-Alexandrium_andersonii.AAC.1
MCIRDRERNDVGSPAPRRAGAPWGSFSWQMLLPADGRGADAGPCGVVAGAGPALPGRPRHCGARG